MLSSAADREARPLSQVKRQSGCHERPALPLSRSRITPRRLRAAAADERLSRVVARLRAVRLALRVAPFGRPDLAIGGNTHKTRTKDGTVHLVRSSRSMNAE